MTSPPTGGAGFSPDDGLRQQASDKPTAHRPQLESDEAYLAPQLKPDIEVTMPDEVWQRVRANAEATIAARQARHARRIAASRAVARCGWILIGAGLILALGTARAGRAASWSWPISAAGAVCVLLGRALGR